MCLKKINIMVVGCYNFIGSHYDETILAVTDLDNCWFISPLIEIKIEYFFSERDANWPSSAF